MVLVVLHILSEDVESMAKKKHIIKRTKRGLKGFSTDSKFVKPLEVADLAINMMRLPDGSTSPRRGYQVQIADIGGLGNSIYEHREDLITVPITINKDGNLYIQQNGSMTISFAGSSPAEYVSYEIYVNPDTVSDNAECDYPPYSVVDEEALVNDAIFFRFKKLTKFSAIPIGAASATYAGILAGFPLTPGSISFTDGTLTIYDDSAGGFYGDVGVGFNAIDYTTGNYSITFSGVTGAVVANYKSTLQVQFNQNVGKGFDTVSPYLISALITQLTGVAGVTVVTTGLTAAPVAFIEICLETNIADGKSATLTWKYWVSANRTVPSTFAGLAAQLSSPNFRNATFAAFNETLYIATGFDEVQKYDGQTVYRAGMPMGVLPGVALTNMGAGTVTPGDHTYYITYEQFDNNGRIVEGVLSDGAFIAVGTDDVNVTVTNLEQATGWNTNGAIIDGVQTSNTINVDPGHTMQVGDKAFFLDSGVPVTNSLGLPYRNVVSRTATSITIDGAPVTVADNDPISNGLKINIYRTTISSMIPKLVRVVPNNSYATTTTWLDDVPDASLGRDYNTPQRLHNPPPLTGIVLVYKNQLIFTQDPINDDYVWYSDPNEPEYVSTADNYFIVPSVDDDITGAGISGSTLIITKDQSLYAISGDLAGFKTTLTPIAPGSNIGCVSHHTIVAVGSLLYFMHTNGIYAIAELTLYPTDKEGNPIALTIDIDRVFRQIPAQFNKKFQLKRAVAVNFTIDNQCLFFIPCEEPEGIKAANNNSRVLCYDYQKKNWYEWTRVNAAGGFYVLNDFLFWNERRAKGTSITSNNYKQHRTYQLIDQVDHVTPIRTTWATSWEDMDLPRIRKKYIRCSLLFNGLGTLYEVNLPVICFYTFADWIEGKISTKTDVTQKIEGSAWSQTPWSWSGWSAYQDSFITIPLKKGTVAKALKVALQMNKLNSSYALQEIDLEISPDFRRTIVR